MSKSQMKRLAVQQAPRELLTSLGEYLRTQKKRIVRERTVAVKNFSMTYGDSTGSETIDELDFEALCEAIDEFGEQFK